MKKALYASVAAAMGMAGATGTAHAALANNAVLDFADGVNGCQATGTYPDCDFDATTVDPGSYFAMDMNGDGVFAEGERNAMASAGTGVTLGSAQGIGEIDQDWFFASNYGRHHTNTGPVPTVATASGNSATIDMTGWTVNWGAEGDIDMGQGADAQVTCGVDCAVGDTFTLEYTATVPSGGFQGVNYQLYLEGTVAEPSAVPVPAAVWLFGSGLLGLVGVARRKKAA